MVNAQHRDRESAAPTCATQAGEACPARRETPRHHRLPYWTGRYDPIEHRHIAHYGAIVSEQGNSGHAFAVRVGTEQRVVATVHINDQTGQRRRVEDLQQGHAPVVPVVTLRGAVLQGLGGIGKTRTVDSASSEEDRLEQVGDLLQSNPKLANLIQIRGVRMDVSQGEHRSFLDGMAIPLTALVGTIRDLNETNTSKGTPHAGAHRVAAVLEAAMRLFEETGTIPDQGVRGMIAPDRYAEARARLAAARPAGEG